MKYSEFKKKLIDMPIFSFSQIESLYGNTQVLKNQLSRWVRKNLLLKLRKGIYVLNSEDRKVTPSRMFIANQLYFPSYVSTEYALSFYDLIPERVADITSVTTKKPVFFRNEFGNFIYRHIKSECFDGFRKMADENKCFFFIASPEKAVIDFLYFNLKKLKIDDFHVFEESYRFQNLSILSKNKIIGFAKKFKNEKLIIVARAFCKFAGRA
ncbi:hypothetical protein AUJ66_01615 [Candidatus Desantisbacteria bacterium CG1_02_38_46]|uniref:Transcriptional regulator n=3 Tax=unclassified Candidatus Desantisiibacteriota TaxID=3106372 RepID=A0A2H9PCV6_9BACT|nr:MAG: hypothetical protein AUJ66_01615 [Candidatus Desantisbacteria bacterium CG1_02_38_46]PIU52123.1 MAG: hypothetical protein COS91_00805 [Candidatus Desantisbacteria bacterium CG07_land_8_20_14_0_80_39_15]PIZ17218.1 MAG: hypothetical protein COY51_00775 [Candidatus Desantisbacteria bacterium CG_4_10_14_0_8_um_filter_39_17]